MAIKHRNKIISGIGLGMFVALIVAGYLPKAHPFFGLKSKTLWDWLSLAGVPVSLAVLGFWLQIQQQKQNDLQKERELRQTKELAAVEREQTKELAIIQREQTEKLATIEQGIAEQNRQEEALQNYYDKVSALLVDKNLLAIAAKGDTTTPEERELLDVSVDVIRARTLATLRKLNSDCKTSLIRFLLEAEVIARLKLSLEGADLEGADLLNANLQGANLSSTNLGGAELRSTNLKEANLSFANLERANLSFANLEGAKLWSANLVGAYLVGAKVKADLVGVKLGGAYLGHANLGDAILVGASLTGADLTGANLTGADLTGADLTEAIGLTKEQLEGENPPFLCRTQLPEGIDIDPNRDCERIKTLLQLLQE